MKKITCLIFLLCLAFALHAQTWEATTETCMKYYEKASYDTALHYAARARAIAEQKDGDQSLNFATSLNNMALIQSQLNNYEEAEALYLQSRDLRKKLLGENNAAYAISLANLASLYKKKGEFEKAEPLYSQALSIKERALGKNSVEYVNVQNNLADLYFRMGRYDKTETMLQDVIVGKLKILGDRNVEYLNAMSNQGVLLTFRGDYVKAEPYLKGVVGGRKNVLGAKHPEYAHALVNLARLYMKQGKSRYKEAEPLFTETLKIWSEITGEKNKQWALAAANLAELDRSMGNLPKAEQLQTKVVGILKQVVGEKDEDYAIALGGLAKIYGSMNNYEKAKSLFSQSLGLQQKIKSDRVAYAQTINDFADFYRSNGNDEDAEPLYIQSVALRKELLGSKSPDYVTSLISLAGVYYRKGNYEKAAPLYEEALPLCKEVFGNQSPEYVDLLSSVAANHEKLGHLEKAEALYREVIPLIEHILGNKHFDYVESLTRLGDLYTQMGNYSKAESHYTEALPILQEVLGEKNPAYPAYMGNLADLYVKLGDLGKSESLFKSTYDNYFNQVYTYYLYANDQERSVFAKQVADFMNNYAGFAIRRTGANAAVGGELLNYHMAMQSLPYQNFSKAMYSFTDTATTGKFNKWMAQRTHIAQLYKLPQSELTQHKVNFVTMEESATKLQKELTIKSPVLGSIATKKAYTWKDVQAKLKEGEAAVAMIRLQHQDQKHRPVDTVSYIALVITKTSAQPKMVVLGNGKDLEGRFFKNYQEKVRTRKIDTATLVGKDRYDEARAKHQTLELPLVDMESYAQYWAPVRAAAGNVKKIYFAPAGVYTKMNINALQNPENRRYVLEENELVVVSSLKDLVTKTLAAGLVVKKGEPALFVAPDYRVSDGEFAKNASLYKNLISNVPVTDKSVRESISGLPVADLSATRAQVEQLQKVLAPFKSKWVVYAGSDASEAAIRSLQNPRMLHLSVQSFYLKDGNAENYLANSFFRSGLLMAGAGRNKVVAPTATDGILGAGEVAQLNLLGTEMVFLSEGEVMNETSGVESVGQLQRAFAATGAEALMLPMWKTDEAIAQEFRTAFYTNWQQLKNKSQAYRKTVNDLKARYPLPAMWGAFVMVGE